ncbi:MAG: TatD DNase family protein [Phycisphaerales bacterium]|jgi:TatD DNase family protein|nr:TatD DNase family protein [Phycisphaerales bacterium]
MIDTHCHLTDPRLFEQLDAVLSRAATAGVERVVTIGTDIEDAMAVIELCERKPQVRCAVGVHPNYSADAVVADVAKLRELQKHPSVVALGEMGLDYHYERATPAHQREIFEAQLQLATEVGRPVVIHCREAVDDTLAVMKSFANVPAVFHCFTGTRDEAIKILDAGYLLGFTGVITFKKNDELREIVKLTPIDRLLVETDAPYLTPEPVRNVKTNEPAFVAHTARVAAQVKGLDYDAFDRVATENALRFYRW